MPHPFNHIDAFPLAQQMEFNSRLLKLYADIMDRVDNLKSVYFTPCFCLKSVLIDKILQKVFVKRQNFAILQKWAFKNDEKLKGQ